MEYQSSKRPKLTAFIQIQFSFYLSNQQFLDQNFLAQFIHFRFRKNKNSFFRFMNVNNDQFITIVRRVKDRLRKRLNYVKLNVICILYFVINEQYLESSYSATSIVPLGFKFAQDYIASIWCNGEEVVHGTGLRKRIRKFDLKYIDSSASSTQESQQAVGIDIRWPKKVVNITVDQRRASNLSTSKRRHSSATYVRKNLDNLKT